VESKEPRFGTEAVDGKGEKIVVSRKMLRKAKVNIAPHWRANRPHARVGGAKLAPSSFETLICVVQKTYDGQGNVVKVTKLVVPRENFGGVNA